MKTVITRSAYAEVRTPATAVHEAVKTMPNRYVMTLVAAQRMREIDRATPHRRDLALMDVASGKATVKLFEDSLKKKVSKK